MRLTVTGSNAVERLALRLGLVPRPAVEAFGSAALWGVLVASVRLGLTAALAQRPQTAADLATTLELDSTVVSMILDCLVASGHARESAGRYRLARSARRWLDPAAPRSVANYVAGAGDYGDWWAGLADAARTGATARTHERPADDPYWRRYELGQLDLARLSAPSVVSRIPLPATARHVLDVGGGHGWYSVELCRRFPAVRATVFDLPGAANIGREIVADAGMAARISYLEGDAAVDDLPGEQDAILLFNLVHHLTAPAVAHLFRRTGAALVPGGLLCVLDGFATGVLTPEVAYVNLFMFLSSGAAIHGLADVREWFGGAGIELAQQIPLRYLPGISLVIGRKR